MFFSIIKFLTATVFLTINSGKEKKQTTRIYNYGKYLLTINLYWYTVMQYVLCGCADYDHMIFGQIAYYQYFSSRFKHTATITVLN